MCAADVTSHDSKAANPLFGRVSAAARLFGLAAWEFSYLDIEDARNFTSDDTLAYVRSLLDAVSGGRPLLVRECDALAAALADYPPDRRVAELRQEHTRLFITPPIRISLNGAAWVKDRTLMSRKKGEAFAVIQYYRDQGLVSQSSAHVRPDSLVSELDFVSYVTAAEAEAWQVNDSASACAWRDLRGEFLSKHLDELARGVSAALERETENPFFLFWARMLVVLVELPV